MMRTVLSAFSWRATALALLFAGGAASGFAAHARFASIAMPGARTGWAASSSVSAGRPNTEPSSRSASAAVSPAAAESRSAPAPAPSMTASSLTAPDSSAAHTRLSSMRARSSRAETRSSSSSKDASWEAFRAAMRRGGGGNGQPEDDAAVSSSAVPLVTPTITFNDVSLWWQYDDPYTLSPASDSAGAFTFESSHPLTLSISGDTATMGSLHRSTVTITARQAAHGAYAAGTATATVTLHTTYCVAEPCLNGATCVPTLGGNGSDNFLCTCASDHYAGIYCEESDLNCYENGGDLICNNGGTCVKDIDGGVCDCINGFCGTYCQTLPSQCGV